MARRSAWYKYWTNDQSGVKGHVGGMVTVGEARSIQVGSTFRLLAAAIQAGRGAECAERAAQLLAESAEGRELFPNFVERARSYLRAELDAELLEMEDARLSQLLAMPDGSTPSIERAWSGLEQGLADVLALADDGQVRQALELLDATRVAWQQVHDRSADLIYGYLDVAARQLGEAVIGPMWDAMMSDFYETRDAYALDRRPWSESFELLLEDCSVSLRGHLSGPTRLGEVEMIEEDDRVIFRFDPCGSGGRTMRPDVAEDGIARVDAPYGFAVTTEAHDWAWGSEGVCLYCVHCCQLQERVPIERLGFPLRVVDPPIWRAGDDRPSCSWSVYRDPSLVPAAAYRRVGFSAPHDRP
jgi:hypothetical protein